MSPSKGEVVIFNRSYYENVLVVRVLKLVERSVWSKRYDVINDFETMLTRHNTTVVPFTAIRAQERFEFPVEKPCAPQVVCPRNFEIFIVVGQTKCGQASFVKRLA